MGNLIQQSLDNGGQIYPLIIPSEYTNGTGIMNPSILIDNDGDILVNLRHVNYTLYHSENKQRFPNPWGPLSYLHPEKDIKLRTENFLLKLNNSFEIEKCSRVEMLSLHEPIWDFIGLEDARLVQWNDEYYLVGVRRDTTDNGQGRMEYTKISIDKENWKIQEILRLRIPSTGDDTAYCEKNWMPIPDMPYHFVKWTTPTEIVYANPNTPETKTVAIHKTPTLSMDQRGGSNIIKWKDYYITITHQVWLWWNYLEQKDSIYRHRLIVWDKDFKFLGASEEFSFLDVPIEFCTGATPYNDDLLISFGVEDNAAYILKTPGFVIDKIINDSIKSYDVNYQIDSDTYEVKQYLNDESAFFYTYKNDLISDVIRSGKPWEPELHDVFKKHINKDSVVIEGGCHIGTHSIILSKLSSQLICFEPLKSSRDILEKNLKINNCNNVEVSDFGLSDSLGSTSFSYVNNGNIGGAVLEDSDNGDIALINIDSLNLSKLDFVKLDIEGYEKSAIIGGIETIKKFKPTIVLECWENYPNASLEHTQKEFSMLTDIGYSIIQIGHHDFLFVPEGNNE